MSTEKILTEKLVLERTRVAKLDEVQRLDLWGEGLTDISLVAKMPNIQVLALAANNVTSLKSLRKCHSLKELYLRKNKIANLREVSTLSTLPQLTVLWMKDNPCAQHEHYRDFVLHCCQGLQNLDSVSITTEERKAAAKRMTRKVLDEILERTPAPPTPHEMAGAQAASPRPGNNAMIEERSANGRNVLFTTVAAQRAMLLSIVSLLSELTVESLELLQREVHERMEKQKEKVTKISQDSPQ